LRAFGLLTILGMPRTDLHDRIALSVVVAGGVVFDR